MHQVHIINKSQNKARTLSYVIRQRHWSVLNRVELAEPLALHIPHSSMQQEINITRSCDKINTAMCTAWTMQIYSVTCNITIWLRHHMTNIPTNYVNSTVLQMSQILLPNFPQMENDSNCSFQSPSSDFMISDILKTYLFHKSFPS